MRHETSLHGPLQPCQVQVLSNDRRLAGRHFPQQFGDSHLHYGDFAFRMEGFAAVLSSDGQGGALLREVAKLEKFEDNTMKPWGEATGMSNS